MSNDHATDIEEPGPAAVEQELRDEAPAHGGDWAAARQRLVQRAQAERLVDIAFEDHESPIGVLRVHATAAGIVRLSFANEDPAEVDELLVRKVSPRILRASTPALTAVRREIDEYFGGTRRSFDVPLDWTLSTPFRRDVLRHCAAIPFGRTASYSDLAVAVGSPGAVRAAGTAMATNPLPLLVPCHRILRSDGTIGQYRGGSAAKAQLLAHEGATLA